MLSLRVPSAQPGTVGSPEANILIKLSARKGILITAVSFLTLGAFFIACSPESLAQLSIGWVTAHKDLLSIILKLVGLPMLAFGSYVGFRKLPSSPG